MPLDVADRTRLQPFVSNLDRNVFALFGLPEEVIAVLFAYYSRSRDDLRTNLARLLADQSLAIGGTGSPCQDALAKAKDKAASFHDKWVVGYGHSSVAEHATVHLAIENVSIVASKVIEDLRLGAFTEKSTRYVVFDTKSFADLPNLPDDLRATYQQSCAQLFTTYLGLFPKLDEKLRKALPRRDNQSEQAYASVIRSHCCDLLRGLLPASTLTNIGLSANARALGFLINKMLSSPLNEVQQVAADMHKEALSVSPTLLRHVEPNSHRIDVRDRAAANLITTLHPTMKPSSQQGVKILRFDTDALARIAIALAFDVGPATDAQSIESSIQSIDTDTLTRLVLDAMSSRGPHDPAPRAFEASSITVELELDYGAFRDLQRHRMLSPFTQLLGCSIGAGVPEELQQLELASEYQSALDIAHEAWTKLAAHDAHSAQYAVPLAFRVRCLWTLNLREAFHVIELRSSKQGHASYRRVAQQLYGALCEVHPWLGSLIRVNMNDYALARDL